MTYLQVMLYSEGPDIAVDAACQKYPHLAETPGLVELIKRLLEPCWWKRTTLAEVFSSPPAKEVKHAAVWRRVSLHRAWTG